MNHIIKNNEFMVPQYNKKTLCFINKLFVVNNETMKWTQFGIHHEGINDKIESYVMRVNSLKSRVHCDLFGYEGFIPTKEEIQELDILYDDIVERNDNWSMPKFLRRILMEEAILTEPDLLEHVDFMCNELLDRIISPK